MYLEEMKVCLSWNLKIKDYIVELTRDSRLYFFHICEIDVTVDSKYVILLQIFREYYGILYKGEKVL